MVFQSFKKILKARKSPEKKFYIPGMMSQYFRLMPASTLKLVGPPSRIPGVWPLVYSSRVRCRGKVPHWYSPLWKHNIAAVLVRDTDSPDSKAIIQHNFSWITFACVFSQFRRVVRQVVTCNKMSMHGQCGFANKKGRNGSKPNSVKGRMMWVSFTSCFSNTIDENCVLALFIFQKKNLKFDCKCVYFSCPI